MVKISRLFGVLSEGCLLSLQLASVKSRIFGKPKVYADVKTGVQ